MLKKEMKNYIIKTIEEEKTVQRADALQVSLFKEELNYIEKHQLLKDETIGEVTFTEKDSNSRFSNAYIERSDKETEELVAEESFAFLNQPIEYLKEHKNEFIYLESASFELVGVESVSLELDDLFGTYGVLLGLKLQKKYEAAIKEYLNKELNGDKGKYSLLFNAGDGLWDLNFALNYTEGFKEDLSIGEAYQLIYHFLFILGEAVEETV